MGTLGINYVTTWFGPDGSTTSIFEDNTLGMRSSVSKDLEEIMECVAPESNKATT